MEQLLNDLLDISRITLNRFELKRRPVELATVIHEVLEMYQPVADRYKHNVIVDMPSESILINGDPVRLTQIFGNLLNNAYKYTQPYGRIKVTVTHSGKEVVISIKDTGIGISQEMLGYIFNTFAYQNRTLDRSMRGLGIGLMLVKQLVEMHGGSVQALSSGLNKGSEFIVKLPVMVEHARNDTAFMLTTTTQPRPRRVLVVDDNKDSADSLFMLLKIAGHEVKTAYDGLQAIAVAEQFRPEVILLDIGMPEMNGYDTCRYIRQQEWGKHIIIAALTGWGQEEDKRKSMEAGFNFHLVKPASLETLMPLLAEIPGKTGTYSN
jgi:CheY-like chemotaxis protein/two-component sensor histidine kinase